jgi:tRNA A37 threonylcarbamoyladenosine synthetase subunit TsaC/SUA5/YrdC
MKIWGKKTLFLSSTDTTLGFLSRSKRRLNLAKNREGKEYITALGSLRDIKYRVPKNCKKLVKRAKRVTFILPNGFSFRIVRDKNHLLLIKRFGWLYTTSANESGKEYDYLFAKSRADVVIYPLKERGKPSKILRLSKRGKIKRVR